MRQLSLVLAVLAGVGIAAQAVINARLRLLLGAPVWAAVAQFVVGLVALLVVALLIRPQGPAHVGLGRAPWWVWTGGLFGATFILVSILLTPRLGAGVMLASTIVGQLVAALVIDHFGLFGATVFPLSPARAIGALLLVAGVFVMRWD